MTLDEALAKIDSLEEEKSEMSKNLVSQRKQFEEKEKTISEERDGLKKTIEDAAAKATQELSDYQESRITAMSKGDKDIADKIRSEFSNLKFDETSREGIDAGAVRAFQLATGKVADPLATRADALPTDVEVQNDEKLTPATADVYKRMFPNTKAPEVGAEPSTQA